VTTTPSDERAGRSARAWSPATVAGSAPAPIARTWRRWLWLGVPLLACLVSWGWWRGAVSVRESRRELAELVERREHLREANRALSREVEALRREREARARAAREALDVVAPAEVLVVVPPPTAVPPPTTVPGGH
jgi:cell division protein FtsB